MSSIILERNGVIEVILCSSHQAGTLSRPSNKYPRSFRAAMVAYLRRSRSVQPSMKCRKRIRRCQNRGLTLPPGSAQGKPEACPSGIRHVGGAKLNLARVRNVRTCRTDAQGEVSSGQNREDESTDAEQRGGVARSRDEGSVMGLDRRGCVVQPRPRANSSHNGNRRSPWTGG